MYSKNSIFAFRKVCRNYNREVCQVPCTEDNFPRELRVNQTRELAHLQCNCPTQLKNNLLQVTFEYLGILLSNVYVFCPSYHSNFIVQRCHTTATYNLMHQMSKENKAIELNACNYYKEVFDV